MPDPSADVYETYGECLGDGPPCCEACAEVTAIADTECSWCGEPIGYHARFRYGSSGLDLYHDDPGRPCFGEVHHDRAEGQVPEADDPFQNYGIGVR